MKHFIIAILLITTSAFAMADSPDHFIVHGKVIPFHLTKQQMITRLGKPKVNANYTTWEYPDVWLMVEFDKYGLSHLTMNSNGEKAASNTGAVIDGKTILLTKDTPKTVKAKVPNLCTQVINETVKTHRQRALVGAEGEISIIFGVESESAKTLTNQPIDTIELTYQDTFVQADCRR